MAKSTNVTYAAFLRLADEMAATGDPPSQAKMVAKLGGSNSTIGPMLRRWKDERAQAIAAGGRSELPRYSDIDAAIAAVVRRAQGDVRDELQADLEGQVREIQDLASELESVRAHEAELTTSNVGLRSEWDRAQGQMTQLRSELEQARAGLAEAATRAGDAEKRVVSAEARFEAERSLRDQQVKLLTETIEMLRGMLKPHVAPSAP